MAYEEELIVARAAAQQAGTLALDYQRRGVRPENKADDSPVTEADRESERRIASLLAEAFPQDGLLGEEGTAREARSGRRWIIDPIDGTRDYIRGNPLWCVLIGLEDGDRTVAGVAHFPALGRTYWASRGGGAFRDGVPIRVSNKSHPGESVLMPNGLSLLAGRPLGRRLQSSLMDWMQRFWAVRSLGGSLDACLVASGEAEVWMEPKVAPWDLAAHQVILEEAGARFFNSQGQASIYGGDAIACVPGLEAEVRRFLQIPR